MHCELSNDSFFCSREDDSKSLYIKEYINQPYTNLLCEQIKDEKCRTNRGI